MNQAPRGLACSDQIFSGLESLLIRRAKSLLLLSDQDDRCESKDNAHPVPRIELFAKCEEPDRQQHQRNGHIGCQSRRR